MSKMSDHHANTAAERADDAERELAELREVMKDTALDLAMLGNRIVWAVERGERSGWVDIANAIVAAVERLARGAGVPVPGETSAKEQR